MISEQDKQAILNGAYAVTRCGHKAKILFTSNINDDERKHLFILERGNLHECFWCFPNLNFLEIEGDDFDIVGLWENESKPFNLEKALAGELVKYSDKPCYVYQSNVTGRFWVEAQDGSFVDNDTPLEDVSEQGMWKEPEVEPKTVTLTLPRPLKAPEGGMWFIQDGEIKRSSYHPSKHGSYSISMLKNGCYFSTPEDAQAWLDAMRNSRG